MDNGVRLFMEYLGCSNKLDGSLLTNDVQRLEQTIIKGAKEKGTERRGGRYLLKYRTKWNYQVKSLDSSLGIQKGVKERTAKKASNTDLRRDEESRVRETRRIPQGVGIRSRTSLWVLCGCDLEKRDL